ncbi:MAG: hypothetical protein ABGX43_08110, partial [Nitrospinaceae bacterium]
MLINKKIVQGVLVLGWLIWSLPVMGAGEHSPHEGKQMGHGAGKHSSYGGAGKRGHAGGKGGKHGGHGYGRPKGPPVDILAHIRERLDSDGTKVNLNRSLIGVKGIKILSEMPELKNVKSLALQGNRLGDKGVQILTGSDTFKHTENLSLWGNGVSAKGARMIAESPNMKNLKEL